MTNDMQLVFHFVRRSKKESALKVQPLKLHDVAFGNQWSDEVEDHWDYEDMAKDDRWRRGWISFDCSLYNPTEDRVYLGITSFDADIFKAYDRKTRSFVDLGYEKIKNPFDAKFHRSLEKAKDGCLYAAVALLHDVDQFFDAPGGAIIKYDPVSRAITKLSVPLPHVYIQSIALDNDRDVIYGLCFPPEKLISLNLTTAEVTDYGLIGTGYGGMAQGENIVLDDAGCLWSNWMLTRAWQSSPGVDAVRLCKVVPQEGRIHFYQKGLPMPDASHGFAKPEAFFNFHDGYIYASGTNGSIYRVHTDTAEADYMFTPIADRPSRLSSMVLAQDGCAYGVTGRAGQCELLRFDFHNDQYELLGPIVSESGDSCWQIHHICIADDGTLYACENDNPYRSSYLWEIKGV